jgi:transposase-like protein
MWTEEAMIAAMEAVKDGVSISRAAKEHGVPRTTLQDRHLGKISHGTKPGPKPYLKKNEEKELV